jgi:hypothetical protein
MLELLFYISASALILCCLLNHIKKNILSHLCDFIILCPEKVDINLYNKWMNKQNLIHESINTPDGMILDACLYNKNKYPSYDDKIYLFSHGISGYLSLILESSSGKYLSEKNTMFIYDYRGFGKSTGQYSIKGCMNDVIHVYDFLINIKKVMPSNIILFGNSMGSCITLHLINHLIENKHIYNSIPQSIILQCPFENIIRVASEKIPFIHKYISKLLCSAILQCSLHTDQYIKKIDKNINTLNICILHSKADEIIDYDHSIKLSQYVKNNKITFIEISGYHDSPAYNSICDNYFDNI